MAQLILATNDANAGTALLLAVMARIKTGKTISGLSG
jgi:hypothetical protein